jgi:uridine kinase
MYQIARNVVIQMYGRGKSVELGLDQWEKYFHPTFSTQ